MSDQTNQSGNGTDAKFLGWQEDGTGKSFALYNIVAREHPLFGSTVSEKSLREMNLKVPDVPNPESESHQ